MSNEYYEYANTFIPGDLARAEDVASEFQALQTGFGLLPTPRSDGGGFSAQFKVPTATDPEHAVQFSQIQGVLDGIETVEEASLAASSVISASNFVGEWGDLTGILEVPASVSHEGIVWLLKNNLADVTLSEPGVSGDWQRATTFDRYDLASLSVTSILDLNVSQVFRVDATAARTLTFANAPSVTRAMTVVVHISGNSAVTWPAGIDWDSDVAPELGDNETKVILFWDGVEWSGFVRVAK